MHSQPTGGSSVIQVQLMHTNDILKSLWNLEQILSPDKHVEITELVHGNCMLLLSITRFYFSYLSDCWSMHIQVRDATGDVPAFGKLLDL